MNARKTLLLAALLGCLLWYIRAVEIPEEGAKRSAQQPFRAVPLEQYAEIAITREGQSFRLVNDGVVPSDPRPAPTPDALAIASVDRSKSWRLADVPAGAVDNGSLNSLLNAVSNLSLETAIPRGELDSDRAVYGLATPSVEVAVNHGGEVRQLRFGSLNEYLSKRYVGWGEDVYLVADGLFNAANKARDDFRKRTPIDFVDSDLRGLAITSPDGELAFSLSDTYRWRMTKPAQHTASDAALAELGRTLRTLRVVEFIDQPPPGADYGLTEPGFVVTLDFKPEVRSEPLTVEFSAARGKSAPDTFMRIRGVETIMRLASDPRSTIVKSPFEYRERALFRFATDAVVDLTIEPREGEKLVLTRAGEEWLVNGLPGDKPFVDEYVKSLAGLEANAFVTPGSARGLDTPTLSVTVTVRGDGEKDAPTRRTLVVGARSVDGGIEKGYYTGVDDLAEPFLIDADKLKRLTPRREALVKVTPGGDGANGESGSAAASETRPVAPLSAVDESR